MTISARWPNSAGGYTRVRRTEGLSRSTIGAVVQGTRRHETPPQDVPMGFSGWSPEAVQFSKGLQADSTKACWSVHKAFCETSVRKPMAALPDELSGESGPGWIARPTGTYGSGPVSRRTRPPRAAGHAGGSMAGLTSTTGVPSIASRASTSIRSPSRATMRARRTSTRQMSIFAWRPI
jgi:hypothetical protein